MADPCLPPLEIVVLELTSLLAQIPPSWRFVY